MFLSTQVKLCRQSDTRFRANVDTGVIDTALGRKNPLIRVLVRQQVDVHRAGFFTDAAIDTLIRIDLSLREGKRRTY